MAGRDLAAHSGRRSSTSPLRLHVPTGSGAMVMAGGIVLLAAVPELPFPVRLIARLLALALFVTWVVLAYSYLASAARGALQIHLSTAQNVFAIGTWVAGTAVVGEVVVVVLPSWRPLVYALGLLGLLLWVWYQWLLIRWFRPVAVDPTAHRVTGSALLSTVSTQSLLLLGVALFPGQVARWSALAVFAIGTLSYLIGAVLIALRYLLHRGWSLVEDWDSTNCILYGALSITGLAAVESGSLTPDQLVPLWLWTAGTFVVVEVIELARAVTRVARLGWRRGLLTYDVSQWARVFTVGMFYAFTTHLAVAHGGRGGWLALLQVPVINVGQYFVLALFLTEVALFLGSHVRWPASRVRPTRPVLRAENSAPHSERHGCTPSALHDDARPGPR